MEWISYFLVLLAICFVWFLFTRIWMGGIDWIISLFKRLFHLNKNDGIKNWHTLEELRERNKKEQGDR